MIRRIGAIACGRPSWDVKQQFGNFGGDDWRERQSATLVVAWMSPRFRTVGRRRRLLWPVRSARFRLPEPVLAAGSGGAAGRRDCRSGRSGRRSAPEGRHRQFGPSAAGLFRPS